MPAPKFVNKFIQYMFDTYSKDGGKLLVHLGALGWVFSSAAQLVVVATDKNIDKNKKKFLLPQEGADAAVNVVMYYSICDIIKKGADKLVEKGKLLTDDVAKALCKIKGYDPKKDINAWNNMFTEAERKMKLTERLAEPDKLNFMKSLPKSEQIKIMPKIEDALSKFESHKNNVGTVAAVLASVLACNIVTPYVRNKVASKSQQYLCKQEAKEVRKTQIKENITMKNPLPASFKAFNNYNSFGNIKI